MTVIRCARHTYFITFLKLNNQPKIQDLSVCSCNEVIILRVTFFFSAILFSYIYGKKYKPHLVTSYLFWSTTSKEHLVQNFSSRVYPHRSPWNHASPNLSNSASLFSVHESQYHFTHKKMKSLSRLYGKEWRQMTEREGSKQ